MRSAGVIVLLALGLAGCTLAELLGAESEESTNGPVSDPVAAVISYLEAVRDSDSTRAWALISQRTKARYDLTPDRLESEVIPGLLANQAASHPTANFRELLTAPIRPDLTVAAVLGDSNHGAYAAAARREQGSWRLELFDPLLLYGPPNPASGIRSDSAALGFTVVRKSARVPVEGRLWLDGRPVKFRRTEDDDAVRFLTRPMRLELGSHSLVAFGMAGDAAGAIAWTFEAR